MILVIIQGLCHRKLEFMFPLWLLLHWVQQSVTLNYRTKVTTPASWRMLCTYIHTIRTYNSHITLIIAWLLNWGEEDRKIVTSKTHFKLKMKQTDQKKESYLEHVMSGARKWYSYRNTIKELKNLLLHLDKAIWFFFTQNNFQNALFWVLWVF